MLNKLKLIFYGFIGTLLALVLVGSLYVGFIGVQTIRAATFLTQPLATGKDGAVFTYADVLRDIAVQAIQASSKQQSAQPTPTPPPAK